MTVFTRLCCAVTTTVFGLGNGHRVRVSNQSIMGRAITNLKRSAGVSFTLNFVAGFRTTKAQFKALKAKIDAYLKRHSLDWKPNASLQIDSGSLEGPIHFGVTVCHLKSWSDGADVWTPRTALIQACLKYMQVSPAGCCHD